MKVHVQGKRWSRLWLRVCEYTFLAAGIAILGYCAYVWLDARVYQRNEEGHLKRSSSARRPAFQAARRHPSRTPC